MPQVSNDSQPLMPDVGVIAVVPEQWGGMWLSRQQILTRMSRYFQVAWVEPQLSWKKLWFGNTSAVSKNLDSKTVPASGFTVVEQSVTLPKVYSPVSIGKFTARRHLKKARDGLIARGCKTIILYVWRPKFADAIDLVDHDISCYHIVDEYSFSSAESMITAQESELISRVDQVFIHSPALMEKKGSINPSTEYITNGVDYDAFASPAEVPRDLRNIPHPRIAYIGRIKIQLDWEVLDRLSERHTNWQFVFVGPMGEMGDCSEIQQRVFARNNVHYLGNKSVVQIPGYTQHADVCLLSYALNDYTKYIFPLKLHECLAAGKAVVGSNIRSLRDFKEVIRIATTPRQWSDLIEGALSDTGETIVAQRRKVAREFDWDQLVLRIVKTLCARLGNTFSQRINSDVNGTNKGSHENVTDTK